MNEKSAGLKCFTFALNAFWRALFVLNLFLFAALAFQTVVWASMYFRISFALPESICARIVAELSERGIAAEFGSIEVDLGGFLVASDVSTRFEGTPEPFLTAEKVRLRFSLPSLLHGDFSPRTIRVINAAIGDTIEGARKNPVVSSLYLDLDIRGEWRRVDAIKFKLGSLSVEGRGFVNANFFSEKFAGGKSGSTPSKASNTSVFDVNKIAGEWDLLLSKRAEFEKYADMFSEPVLNTEFTLFGGDESIVRAVLVASAARFEIDGRQACLAGVSVAANVRGSIDSAPISVYAYADDFSCDGLSSFKKGEARAKVILADGNASASDIEIAVSGVSYDGAKIGAISLHKNHADADDWGEDWYVFAEIGNGRAGGRVSAEGDGSATFEFSGLFDPSVAFSLKALAEIGELKQFSFPNGIVLNGSGKYVASKKELSVSGAVEADGCVVMDIAVAHLRGDVSYDGALGLFDARNVRVETVEGWALDGSFVQNFKTNDYYIKLIGDIRPMSISHFMEPWWTRIMSSFSFDGDNNFPKADVSVEGRWGSPEFIWCYARASGENALYDGAKFSKFSLDVWVNPSRITLYNIDIDASGRRASGLVEWLYGAEGITTFNRQNVWFDSSLNPEELVALGGADAKEVLDIVRFKEAPHIVLNAVLRNPSNNPEKLSDLFNVEASSIGETQIDRATLSDLKFSAKSDKTDTQVENAVFKFCGGDAAGGIRLQKRGGKVFFDSTVYAEKMNQAKFIAFLQSLGSTKETSVKSDETGRHGKKSLVDGGENGEITMSLSLVGDVDNIERSRGDGYANLENPDLIKLNFFGAISRVFSSMRLPFGSFDITYAYSPFSIGDGEVKFTKLEMGGPVMQIRGAAAYNFIEDDIDATLAVRPFGGLTMPIVSSVFSIINPFTNFVQVELDGKIDDPSIAVNANPMNMLKSDSRIIDKIRESL